MEAILALEDGTWFKGVAAGADGEARGEVVFNTSMTGYQEVLTDPSYSGQIVTMTCPEIGNYGVSPQDVESRAPQVADFIVREESPITPALAVARHACRLSSRTRSSPFPTSIRARLTRRRSGGVMRVSSRPGTRWFRRISSRGRGRCRRWRGRSSGRHVPGGVRLAPGRPRS